MTDERDVAAAAPDVAGDALGYDATGSGLDCRPAPPDRPAGEMVDPARRILEGSPEPTPGAPAG